MSNIDTLTGIYNRKHFLQLLESEIPRARRYKRSMGLLLINVDDFTQINETLSHDVGDQVLVDVAKLIKSHQREIDVVCRYNNGELSVLLVETNTAQSVEVAQRIRTLIESHDFSYVGKSVTVSIGHTQYRQQPANEFIESADKILLESKGLGKNRVTSDSV